jgi:hypothetical protein
MLYHRTKVLNEAIEWLREHRYRILVADADSWLDSAAMHADVAALLEFPAYYGANLDALSDSLGSLVTPRRPTGRSAGDEPADATEAAPGVEPETGIVLVLRRFDSFVSREPLTGHALIDIVARQARLGALFGRRLLCLLQTGDPALQLAAVGATPVPWNDVEQPDAERGHANQ